MEGNNVFGGLKMNAPSPPGLLCLIDRLFRTGTAAGLSDDQLLERFATRHDEAAEAAFGALMERHGPMVLSVCRRTLTDPNDALDAFQATFLILIREADSVRKRRSLASWLFGVARRVSAHTRGAEARRRQIERRAERRNVVAFETTTAGGEVWEEVDRLPETLRAAVVLCYLEGLTHEQAADRLGWPVGTVRSRLARARNRLRTRLARRGLAPEGATLSALMLKAPPLQQSVVGPMIKAAMLTGHGTAEAGLTSAAVALTEGVVRSMLLTKLKFTALGLFVAAALAAAAGEIAHRRMPAVGTAAAVQVEVVSAGPAQEEPQPPGTKPKAPDVDASIVPPLKTERRHNAMEMRLKRALRVFQRRQELWKSKAISSQVLEDARGNVESLIAEIETQHDDLADQAEVLAAQLEAKRSELRVAEAQLQQAELARRHLSRLKENLKTVDPLELGKAEIELKVQTALRDTKRAEVRETEVRLKHVRRKLDSLEPLTGLIDEFEKQDTAASAPK
jgi:RNA polymerase sigma factor (sigma-70 family)